ncbi:MAG: helix-turn-helix transcriptional regulator [Mycetocola sp.]
MLIDEDFHTSDTAEAEALIEHFYRRGRLVEGHQPFQFRQQVRGDERASVAHYQISSRTDFAVDIDGILAVGMLSGGTYSAQTNGREIDASRPFLLRPGAAQSSSVGLDLTMAYLDLDALAAIAFGEGSPTARLRFDLVAPVSADAAKHWAAAARFLDTVIADDELFRNDVIRRSATDVLLACALKTFGLTTQDADGRLNSGPASLRRALQFIEDHAPEAITVVDIATAARLSPRGLQNIFQKELGTTPLTYLRRARLDGAHQELISSDTADTTVAEIANRWGFAHMPKFASYYREIYGTNPHETLRS